MEEKKFSPVYVVCISSLQKSQANQSRKLAPRYIKGKTEGNSDQGRTICGNLMMILRLLPKIQFIRN